MTKVLPLLLFIIFSIILAACAGTPASTMGPEPLGTPTGSSTTACSLPTNWTIPFNRSGGFAGANQALTLQSNGSLKIESENPPVNAQKIISEEQVSAITDLLVRACPFEMQPNDLGCEDCFIYKLNVQMDAQAYRMLATDVTLTDEVYPLVNMLNQLLQDKR